MACCSGGRATTYAPRGTCPGTQNGGTHEGTHHCRRYPGCRGCRRRYARHWPGVGGQRAQCEGLQHHHLGQQRSQSAFRPSERYTAKGLLATGDKIRVTATSPGGRGNCFWYKVKLNAKAKNGLPKGTTGWVSWVYVRKLVDKGTQGC
ncbi:SH3 domain-containing protein [Streptomyces sp. NPDC029004]|uniref:SH3 domain-containing protein n=1 Tax=Streptomyces sp. NPDC029004 TaxID=3154490 RepID=UPI0033D5E81E